MASRTPVRATRFFRSAALLLWPALVLPSSAVAESAPIAPAPLVHWVFRDASILTNPKTTVLGAPRVSASHPPPALQFDGAKDGLILAENPLEGFSTFTVEILLRPEPDGLPEQRFFHADAASDRRVLMELRLDSTRRNWSLDTFLHESATEKLTLIDRAKLHPTGVWTWVALTYDGKIMKHYVGGVKELEGPVRFGPMGTGQTAVGLRLTRNFWFKGSIAEVRIYDRALPAEELKRAAD